MAEHPHDFRFDGIDMFECAYDDCNERIDMDQVEKCLCAFEDMRTWKNGIYTGNQMRDYARIVCGLPAAISI